MTNQEKMDLAKKQLKHCLNSKDCQTCDFWNKGEAMIVCQQLVLSCFEISGLIKNNEEAGFWKFISDNKDFSDCTKCIHSQQTEPHVWECDAKEYDIDTKSCWKPKETE